MVNIHCLTMILQSFQSQRPAEKVQLQFYSANIYKETMQTYMIDEK